MLTLNLKNNVIDLLHLELLYCLFNLKAWPSIGQVNGMLLQIRDIENVSTITMISMLSLLATKPLGLYHSLEFSQKLS